MYSIVTFSMKYSPTVPSAHAYVEKVSVWGNTVPVIAPGALVPMPATVWKETACWVSGLSETTLLQAEAIAAAIERKMTIFFIVMMLYLKS